MWKTESGDVFNVSESLNTSATHVNINAYYPLRLVKAEIKEHL